MTLQLAAFGYISSLFSESMLNAKKKELEGDAFLVKNQIKILSEDKYGLFYNTFSSRITLIDGNGTVRYDNRANAEEMDSHLYREEIKEAIEGVEAVNIRVSRSTGKKLIYLAVPLENNMIVRISDDYSEVESAVGLFNKKLFLILLLINGIIYMVYSMIMAYINKKTLQIKKAIEGEELTDIFFYDDEKLKELWISLKKLYKKNKANIETVESETHKLSEIISSVDMGILVIKTDGNILLYNKVIERDFIEDAENDDYHMRIKNMQVIKFINRLQLHKETIKEELYVSPLRKYFIAEGKYLPEKEYIIVTLKDITKDKELNEIQKRFITNISHELKTPLTNIKGYLIALEDEKDEKTRKMFIETMSKNVIKMERMVIDFLDTSKIENSKVLNAFPVKALKLEEELRDDLKQLLENRHAEFSVEFNLLDEYGYIKVDYEKIFMMIRNMVENGIIYNDKESPKVTFSITEKEREYVFCVEDNGIGIPKNEIPKVFERFYRVNKARNGEYIGTGLGLSIVKEIVKLHNGYVNLESTEGTGTKITAVIRK